MAFFEWNDAYCIGVEQVDEQHKRLVEMVEQFYNAMSMGKAQNVLDELLNGLIEYTIVHFKTEEELMDKYHYPFSLNHKFKHKELTKTVVEFQTKVQSGNKLIAIELGGFLKNWLLDHIKMTDMELGVFLQQKGLN